MNPETVRELNKMAQNSAGKASAAGSTRAGASSYSRVSQPRTGALSPVSEAFYVCRRDFHGG